MNKKTSITLRADTIGNALFCFVGMAGLGNPRLSYETTLPENYEGGLAGLISKLLGGIQLICDNPQTGPVLKALFEHSKLDVLSSGVTNSFTLSGVAGFDGFTVAVEIHTLFQNGEAVRPQMRAQGWPQGAPFHMGQPIPCVQDPRQMAAMGYATYGQRNEIPQPTFGQSFFQRTNPLEMLNNYIKKGTDPFAIPRGELGDCLCSDTAMKDKAAEFSNYCKKNPATIQHLAELLPVLLSAKRTMKSSANVLVQETAYLEPFRHFLLALDGGRNSHEIAYATTLVVIDAINRLDASPKPGEETEKDFREEAELAIFRLAFISGNHGIALVDYDPRDNWDRAVEQFPSLTEFCRRVAGMEGKQPVENDEELLAQVLETPHSTPAAAAAALYVLDELGRGLPTPVLLELLPTTFVQDYSDYCNALGGEGPFGFNQLTAVKEALIKRWFISYDSALAVLRTNLNPLGFSVEDPTAARKLELAAMSLMEDRTLLYVDSASE